MYHCWQRLTNRSERCKIFSTRGSIHMSYKLCISYANLEAKFEYLLKWCIEMYHYAGNVKSSWRKKLSFVHSLKAYSAFDNFLLRLQRNSNWISINHAPWLLEANWMHNLLCNIGIYQSQSILIKTCSFLLLHLILLTLS